jgi:VCBS repeat-containing protein
VGNDSATAATDLSSARHSARRATSPVTTSGVVAASQVSHPASATKAASTGTGSSATATPGAALDQVGSAATTGFTAAGAPTTAVSATLSRPAAAAVNPLIRFLGGLLSLFGLNTSTAPANPLGALLWGVFRQIEKSTGLTPVAGTPTVGTPDPITGAVTGELGFTEPAGQALTYAVSTKPTLGTVTVTAAGVYTYTPTQAARLGATVATTDTFTVTASDGVAATAETVTVSVSPLADVPLAGTPTVGIPDITTGALSGNAEFTDPGGRTLTYSAPATSTGGATVAINATTGVYTYTPTVAQRQAATAATTDTFTVAADNGIVTATETVTVHVLPVVSGGGGGGVDIPVPGIPTVGLPDPDTGVVTGAAVFTDPGAHLTYSAPTTTANGGTISIDPATGAFLYTPPAGVPLAGVPLVGTPDPTTGVVTGTAVFTTGPSQPTDTFTVTASNGTHQAAETVTVTDAPPDTSSDLSYSVTTDPTLGSITSFDDSTGAFTFTPSDAARQAALAGTGATSDTFTVTAVSATDAMSTASETITVPITSADPFVGNWSIPAGLGAPFTGTEFTITRSGGLYSETSAGVVVGTFSQTQSGTYSGSVPPASIQAEEQALVQGSAAEGITISDFFFSAPFIASVSGDDNTLSEDVTETLTYNATFPNGVTQAAGGTFEATIDFTRISNSDEV